MHVALTCSDAEGAQDQRSLSEWLPKAAPGMDFRLSASDLDGGENLGNSVDEIFTVISGAAELAHLLLAIRGWARNRFGHRVAEQEPKVITEGLTTKIEFGKVKIVVTRDPDEDAPAVDLDER